MNTLSLHSRKKSPIRNLATVIIGLTLSFSVIAGKQDIPEVDKDGLHLLKDTKAAFVYAMPGTSLEPYTKVKILDCFVDFQKDWQRDYDMSHLGLAGRVTDKDAEKIKQRLAEEFNKVFTEVMTKEGHEVVSETGPGTLLLRPALINIDVIAPDVMGAGMHRTLVQSAGGMTLYMELYDSTTSTLLARVIDPQADDGLPHVANRVTNKAAADRILRGWAKLLASHLGDVKTETVTK